MAISVSAPVDSPKKPQTDVFEPAFQTTKPPKKPDIFEPIYVKPVPEREVQRSLHLREFKQMNVSPPKPILIERKTKVYNMKGEFVESFPKGIFVEFDSTKPVIVAPDGKTYSQVLRHDNTPDRSHVFERLLLRTPSLDADVRTAKRVEREAARTTTLSPKKNFFDGYLGYRSNIIPPAALEKATKEYLAKVLAPKVQANIAKTETVIVKTREEIKTEVLFKKKSIEEIPSYHEQKKALSKKFSLTKVNQAIESFTNNGTEALVNPDVEKLLESLKKTPEWQKILQQATAAENAKVRKRYRG